MIGQAVCRCIRLGQRFVPDVETCGRMVELREGCPEGNAVNGHQSEQVYKGKGAG